MGLKEILDRFEGEELDLSQLGDYPRWALQYFHNKDFVINPLVEMTLQWEITKAEFVYRNNYSKTNGASFTAYLTWNLIRSLRLHPCFQYRHLNGKWYYLKKAPICFPVAVKDKNRLRDVFLENIYESTWEKFCSIYRKKIGEIFSGRGIAAGADEELFYLSTFLGNLPHFQFTHLAGQKTVQNTGRAMFYFGKRYQSENKLYVPLCIAIDHSNTDPIVLTSLLEDFRRFLEEKESSAFKNI